MLFLPPYLCYGQQIEPSSSNVLYVNKSVQGGAGSGNSWANAIPELADALKWANQNKASWESNVLHIWVAKGTYTPKYSPEDGNFGNPDGYNNTFLMVKNVRLLGGFSGGEASESQRDIDANSTVLSGDLDGNSTPGNNDACHVLVSAGDVGAAELSGFTVSRGYAQAFQNFSAIQVGGQNFYHSWGAGMQNVSSSPFISRCTFTNNQAGPTLAPPITFDGFGGAIANINSEPVMSDCVFTNNKAIFAGAVFNSSSTQGAFLTITNCVFSNNTARSSGAVWNLATSGTIHNCTFQDNMARSSVGAMTITQGGLRVSNSTFIGNYSNDNGGVFLDNTTSLFVNCLFAGNRAFDEPIEGLPLPSNSTGGALAIGRSTVTLTNVTIAGNHADLKGGGMSIYQDSQVTLKNSIVTGNTALGNRNLDVVQDQDARIYVSYSLLEGDPATWIWGQNGTGINHGNNIITTAPVFSGQPDDYSLFEGSPAVDQGDNQSYTDAGGNLQSDRALGGNPRVDAYTTGGRIDMGAYEFNATGLPVTLAFFEVRSAEGAAELYWRTSSESGSDRFEIERSPDGRTWEKIGSVPAAANSDAPTRYTFSDSFSFSTAGSLLSTLIYYRLKMIDRDEAFAYSPIRSIKMSVRAAFRVYPNPAKDYVNVEVDRSTVGSRLSLTNVAGTVLKQEDAGNETVTIDIRDLAPGIYLLGTGNGRMLKVMKH